MNRYQGIVLGYCLGTTEGFGGDCEALLPELRAGMDPSSLNKPWRWLQQTQVTGPGYRFSAPLNL
jgi:hypothetical protein